MHEGRARGVCLAAAIVATTMACTWVPLTEEGGLVRFTNANEVVDCERLATTEVTVKDEVWIFARSDKTVREELRTLARNQAAKKGGDTVVPLGPEADGVQRFAIYRCGD